MLLLRCNNVAIHNQDHKLLLNHKFGIALTSLTCSFSNRYMLTDAYGYLSYTYLSIFHCSILLYSGV